MKKKMIFIVAFFVLAILSATIDIMLLGIDLSQYPMWAHASHKTVYIAYGAILVWIVRRSDS